MYSNSLSINSNHVIYEKCPEMTKEEYMLFRTFIYKESGIYFKDTKKEFMESRVKKRLKEKNIRSMYQYYKYISGDGDGRREFLTLLDALTIGETSFFRNRPQFNLFRDKILPEIIDEKSRANCRSIKIWSAGCSTGEEPYTIAMESFEALKRSGSQVLCQPVIIASDIALSALKTAKAGVYNRKRIEGVEDKYIQRYFNVKDEDYIVSDEIRQSTIFDFHNLKNENGLRGLDIIFCRNVMIYFDLAEQKRVIDKFHNSLRPGGYLFIGHSETLQGLDDRFKFIYLNKGTAYKRI